MAILGTLIDKTTISRAGDALKGVTTATVAHSLPATNPQILLPNVISYAEMAGNGTNGFVRVFGLGGNASLATVGYAMASCVSAPTVCYDLYAIVFHSLIK